MGGVTWALILFGLANIYYPFTLILIGFVAWISFNNRNHQNYTETNMPRNVNIKLLVVSLIYIIIVLVSSVVIGLLGSPESFIISPYSSNNLIWVNDIYTNNNAYMLSLPGVAYKLFMFAWSVWLAFIIIKIATIVINQIKDLRESK